MDDLKLLLDAEQEKVTKLKALLVKERKANTKIKSELEYLKSLHTGTNQEGDRTVKKIDKSCGTSEVLHASTFAIATQTSELDSTIVKSLIITENNEGVGDFHVPTDNTNNHEITHGIKASVCEISASYSCKASANDVSKKSDQNLDISHLEETNIVPVNCLCAETQVENSNYFNDQHSLLSRQFNIALQRLNFHTKNYLSKDELELIFTECNRLLEEIDYYSTDNYSLSFDNPSFKSGIMTSGNYRQTIPIDLNQPVKAFIEPIKQHEEHDLYHSKTLCESKHAHTDIVCNNELHLLEERVNELKHSVEHAESSFNQLSNKLTSVNHISEMYDAKLLQLQATYSDNSLDTIHSLSFIKLKTLLYDSFLLPLIKYYQEMNNNAQYDLDVDFDNFQDDTNNTIAKNLVHFLDEIKQSIKHYYILNNRCIALSDACIQIEYNNDEVNVEHKKLLDRLKQTESELIIANQKISVSENLNSELKSQLQVSEEKLQRMKNLLVKVKLDATEQQKKLVELQKSQCVDVENSELNCLAEKLSSTEKEKEDLEYTLANLRNELTQQHVLFENLQHEKRLAIDRLQKLQSEYAAYKVKARHTLSNTRSLTSELNTLNGGDTQNAEAVNTNLPDFGNRSNYLDELECIKQNLFDVQNRLKETELRASLAQSECDLLKKESMEAKTRYTELICQSQKQNQSLEDQILSITQQYENRLSTELNELEQKYTTQLHHYEERLVLQTQKYESELRHEREIWEAKLSQITHVNDSPTQNSHKFEQTHEHRRNLSILDNLSEKPHYKRVQGDGADNTIIPSTESDIECEHAVRNYSFSRRGSEHYSLADEEIRDTREHKIVIPTLEQLLNRPNHHSPYENTTSQHPNKSFQEVRNVPSNQLSGLKSALANQQRRVEYLSELLSESEINTTRLFEQNKLLKEEIRRLENNTITTLKLQGTENQDMLELNNSLHSNSNNVLVEHLRNILLKVITLPKQSSERNHLMRALATFLSLKSDESKLLEEGLNQNVTCSTSNQQQTSDWSSYISAVWR
ncbi:GRIP and coiled-coil domain-containing 2 [Schistosoma japonicum]|nr:GRIP and coiled-coil domain-containing 2 [Schistosoma japonicum]